MRHEKSFMVVYPASFRTASDEVFTNYGKANNLRQYFPGAHVWERKRWLKHKATNRINTCPRYHAAKVIDSLMKKEWRDTLGQYKERLKTVRREVQTLLWNRVRTDVPGFAINY